jgi:hypothetical protein
MVFGDEIDVSVAGAASRYESAIPALLGREAGEPMVRSFG